MTRVVSRTYSAVLTTSTQHRGSLGVVVASLCGACIADWCIVVCSIIMGAGVGLIAVND